ncbi:cinnamoyl-CoA reductase 1-like [Phragmites australis]|uniref:cinnamoyl-CoA reductase 1-like n=1 Tax=Phragmites australis TaxID=29695 RepID=UPI002D794080|nr:cinnamoyl-CoA reductase 1-like [Phragmites australis]
MAGRTVEGAAGSGETVCVTGAGGYIASWLVKLLLSRGYTVHGTVRDLSDKKTAHLKRLENASESLKLFKADLLDYDAMAAAIAGCQGVFHVATPVPSVTMTDPELSVICICHTLCSNAMLCTTFQREMLDPAVSGTTNVLKAASAANVHRVVVVSSMVAVEINPKDWPKDKIKDESCWSDKELCRDNENWYSVAKITSEEVALEYGKQTGLDVVTVNPALVFGPLLQPTLNTSCQFLVYFLKGGPDETRNKLWHIVDVRDTADALLLVYEEPEASGRHICAPHVISARDLLDLLKNMYTEYTFMNKESICDMDHSAPMTSDKLRQLGWSYRSLEETIADTVEFFKQAGFLDDVEGVPCRFPPVYNKI